MQEEWRVYFVCGLREANGRWTFKRDPQTDLYRELENFIKNVKNFVPSHQSVSDFYREHRVFIARLPQRKLVLFFRRGCPTESFRGVKMVPSHVAKTLYALVSGGALAASGVTLWGLRRLLRKSETQREPMPKVALEQPRGFFTLEDWLQLPCASLVGGISTLLVPSKWHDENFGRSGLHDFWYTEKKVTFPFRIYRWRTTDEEVRGITVYILPQPTAELIPDTAKRLALMFGFHAIRFSFVFWPTNVIRDLELDFGQDVVVGFSGQPIVWNKLIPAHGCAPNDAWLNELKTFPKVLLNILRVPGDGAVHNVSGYSLMQVPKRYGWKLQINGNWCEIRVGYNFATETSQLLVLHCLVNNWERALWNYIQVFAATFSLTYVAGVDSAGVVKKSSWEATELHPFSYIQPSLVIQRKWVYSIDEKW